MDTDKRLRNGIQIDLVFEEGNSLIDLGLINRLRRYLLNRPRKP